MGQDDAGDVRPLLFEKGDVGENQIDAREVLLTSKGDAEIDDKPLSVALFAKSVNAQVHADFAGAAKRHENKTCHKLTLRRR